MIQGRQVLFDFSGSNPPKHQNRLKSGMNGTAAALVIRASTAMKRILFLTTALSHSHLHPRSLCPSVRGQCDPLRHADGTYSSCVNGSDRSSSNRVSLNIVNLVDGDLRSIPYGFYPRCGRLPSKHSQAHPPIAKPKRSLFYREKCGRMAHKSPAGHWKTHFKHRRTQPGWLGKRRCQLCPRPDVHWTACTAKQ